LPAFQHFLPAECSRQGFDESTVNAGFLNGRRFAVWCYDLFSTAIFADGEGDMNLDAILAAIGEVVAGPEVLS
jgi:hypothetical protein